MFIKYFVINVISWCLKLNANSIYFYDRHCFKLNILTMVEWCINALVIYKLIYQNVKNVYEKT